MPLAMLSTSLQDRMPESDTGNIPLTDLSELSDWGAIAFNQVPDSKNEIHGDRVAKAFGFKGGLVPGVTVSAYLMHPAAVQFGRRFAEMGFAHCRVSAPLYDEENFTVRVSAQAAASHAVTLFNAEHAPRATAEVRLPEHLSQAPSRRGDPIAEAGDEAIRATPDNMRQLQETGCRAFRHRWHQSHQMATYLRDPAGMATCYADERLANPSFILGVSNWVLASNAAMNPWVHMETKSQNFAVIPDGVTVVSEMTVDDLFNRKGHEFVDVTVNVFDVHSSQCYASVELRAIYQLRGA
ncbi:MAG: hypothetical protein ACI8Z1_000740 [Candidatus Azotimanducaceae bacterium]|jgi:hypothetical protein